MSRKWFATLVGLVMFTALSIAWGWIATPVAESQTFRAPITPTPISTPPSRQPRANPDTPTISFIDSNTATCYRPADETGICYIDWSYLYVTANSGQYIISMTVTIDGQLRAYHSGFFQSWMYIPGDQYGDGFKVSCGAPGVGRTPGLGNTYGYVIRARETGGQSTANSGTVTCPADTIRFFMPKIGK